MLAAVAAETEVVLATKVVEATSTVVVDATTDVLPAAVLTACVKAPAVLVDAVAATDVSLSQLVKSPQAEIGRTMQSTQRQCLRSLKYSLHWWTQRLLIPR